MILSDNDLIELPSLVSPFKSENVQPASIDLTLDTSFTTYIGHNVVDLADVPGTIGQVRKRNIDHYRLNTQQFVLGCTAEYVSVPNNLVGIVEGKSSLARLGLLVHITAGFLDPGFHGKITLEFFNCSHRPIILQAGLKICQVSFTYLKRPAAKPYGHPDLGSKYQNQIDATESRYVG